MIFTGGDIPHTYHTEAHGIIGPYCPDCFAKIIFCRYCNKYLISTFTKKEEPYTCLSCKSQEHGSSPPPMPTPENSCDNCGNHKGELIKVDNVNICKECSELITFLCDICGKLHFNGMESCKKSSYTFLLYEDSLAMAGIENTTDHCISVYAAKHSLEQMDVYSCNRCGNATNNISKYGKFCKSCEARLKPCSVCKKLCVPYQNVIGSTICTDCFQKKQYKYCHVCGMLERVTICHDKKNFKKYTCSQCRKEYSTNCDKCGSLINDEGIHKIGDLAICNSCMNYHRPVTCVECNIYTTNPYYKDDWIPGESGVICRTCLAKKGKADINKWDYTPAIFYRHGKSNDGLYLGFENEVWTKNTSIYKKTLANIIKHYKEDELYPIFDGSIGGVPYGEPGHGTGGFELVSHIFTLTSFNKINWSHLFTQNTTKHLTCGMHIHLSKQAFTTFHLYKFMKFIYNNSSFIKVISERDTSNYALNFDGSIKHDAKVKQKEKSDTARRVKVNLCNEDTVELRFFASVNNVFSLKKNMEFAHSLFYFTKNNSLRDATKPSLFKRYVVSKRVKYSNLNKFIKRGY